MESTHGSKRDRQRFRAHILYCTVLNIQSRNRLFYLRSLLAFSDLGHQPRSVSYFSSLPFAPRLNNSICAHFAPAVDTITYYREDTRIVPHRSNAVTAYFVCQQGWLELIGPRAFRVYTASALAGDTFSRRVLTFSTKKPQVF